MANLSSALELEVELTVTPDDINNGTRMDCAYCPVALAIRRVFPDYVIAVGTSGVSIARKANPNKIWATTETFASRTVAHYMFNPMSLEYPIDVTRFIKTFDSEPFAGIEGYPNGFTFKMTRTK